MKFDTIVLGENMEWERTRLLLGDDLEKVRSKTILIIGLGGVGSYVCESLARMGVSHLILVDSDVVDVTNINRQLYALHSTIGMPKVEVAKRRIGDISLDIKVDTYHMEVTEDNFSLFFKEQIDYVVDACDTVSVKKEVIRYCSKNKILFITCAGTGNKIDPLKLDIMDIRKTSYDPLAKILRKMVKDEHIKGRVPVVCSTESPIKTNSKVIASCSFVPSVAGLLCTSYIVRDIVGDLNV